MLLNIKKKYIYKQLIIYILLLNKERAPDILAIGSG